AATKHVLSFLSGAELSLMMQIGPGLQLHHPNGVVLHPDAVLGADCVILQQVTLGTGGRIPGAPTLGDRVIVGAAAKVRGGVPVGSDAVIGATAVVIRAVPAGAVVGGVPARILRMTSPHQGRMRGTTAFSSFKSPSRSTAPRSSATRFATLRTRS